MKIGVMSLRSQESAEIVADAILLRCRWREFGFQTCTTMGSDLFEIGPFLNWPPQPDAQILTARCPPTFLSKHLELTCENKNYLMSFEFEFLSYRIKYVWICPKYVKGIDHHIACIRSCHYPSCIAASNANADFFPRKHYRQDLLNYMWYHLCIQYLTRNRACSGKSYLSSGMHSEHRSI